jgi:hypothetical protein
MKKCKKKVCLVDFTARPKILKKIIGNPNKPINKEKKSKKLLLAPQK